MAKSIKKDVTKKEILEEFIRDTKKDILIKQIAHEYYATQEGKVKEVMASEQEMKELEEKLAFFERLLKKE